MCNRFFVYNAEEIFTANSNQIGRFYEELLSGAKQSIIVVAVCIGTRELVRISPYKSVSDYYG